MESSRDDTLVPGLKPSLLAIFLVSFSVLVFEVALTRIFSVMLTYHFVFVIISIAMFGLGLGGILFKRWGRWVSLHGLWIGVLAFSLLLAGSLVLILVIPVGFQETAALRLALYLLLALLPFAAAGLVVAGLFQSLPTQSPLLYGLDLLGAAAGVAAVVPGMNLIGPVNLVLLAAVVAALAALALGLPRVKRAFAAGLVAVILGGTLAGIMAAGFDPAVPVSADRGKDMAAVLADPAEQFRIAESKWSSFGRTDLLESPLYPTQKYLFVDGAAGSIMYDLDSVLRDPEGLESMGAHSGEAFPFQFLKDDQKRTALILGPGGGQDVVTAILGGVKDITAVEVNPDVVDLVRKYRDFAGGIYSGRPGVSTVVAEGRNFVRTSGKKYDLIMAAIPVTKSSRSVEGYALTENNLFTVEAFEDYLDHLNDDGRLILVAHNNKEVYRLVGLTLAAFAKQGLPEKEAMNRIFAIGSEMMPTLVVQKQPLSQVDSSAIHGTIHRQGLDQGLVFIPGVEQQVAKVGGNVVSMLDPGLVRIAQGVPSASVLAADGVDLSPTTDDRPFFYDFKPGLPTPFPLFLGLLVVSFLTLGVLLVLPRRPLEVTRQGFISQLRRTAALKIYLSLFFALGIAYMAVEIAIFQKLALYISQPQMNLTILLSSLLLGGGAGSLLTARLGRWSLWAAGSAAVLVAASVPALTLVLPSAFGLGLDPRLTAFGLVFPLGVLMGFPFPIAISSLAKDGFKEQTAVMWGVNGATSVLGSALAMIIGLTWGFSRALFVGAAFYLVIAGLLAVLARKKSGVESVDVTSFTRHLPSVGQRSTPHLHTR